MPITRSAAAAAATTTTGAASVHSISTSIATDEIPSRTRQQSARGMTLLALSTGTLPEAIEPEDPPKTKRKSYQRKSSVVSSKKARPKKQSASLVLVESIAVPVTPDNSLPSSPTIDEVILKSPATPKPKSTSLSNKKSPTRSPTALKHQRPAPKEDWESLYQLVIELRADRTAPVDTDGSEALPQRELGPQVYRFQVLIALMLSSQTKDAVVGDAMRKLQAHGLTVPNILKTSFDKVNELIGKVGFHNTKANNILKVAEILNTQYGGDIPTTAQEMIDQLPGVGPKMAFIVENVAWGRQTGIGVDTHMHRMFNQLKWVDSKQPEQTRMQLESWLPQEYWPTVNLLWVGLGQEVQQFPDKLLRKALDSSRPREALKLLKRLGMDYTKVGTKMGWSDELQAILKDSSKISS